MKPILVCIAALAFLAANCILAINRTSITADEIIHIPAGYYSLTQAENRMNAEHPPLAKLVAALPLQTFLPQDDGPAQAPGNFSERGAHFYNHFWEVFRNRVFPIWFWARSAMVAIPVALGILLFFTTRQWFGATAAGLAVVLYSLEPNILGHGRLVHTDVAAAFVYLLFFVLLYRYIKSSTRFNACLVGAACGIALATKFSMLVLLPVLGTVFLFRVVAGSKLTRGQRFGHPLLAALVILFVVNLAYGFRNPPLGPDEDWIKAQSRHPQFVLKVIETLSPILPRDFSFGAYVVAFHNDGGHSGSILGKYDYRGWWYYFPVAFAFKTPIPLLLLSVIAILWSLSRVIQKDYKFLYALVPLAIYCALAMSSRINIGIRHFLPAFPFLIMLSGALLAALSKRLPKLGVPLAAVVLAVMGFEAVRTFPYYLSYVNQLNGNAPSWRYLSDSNVEWGDAVPELVKFLRAKGESRVSGALLGGRLTLRFYDIEFVDLFAPSPHPETRYVALGGSFLNGSTVEYGDATNGRGNEKDRVNFFDAYRKRKPVAIFGNSIYVFESKY